MQRTAGMFLGAECRSPRVSTASRRQELTHGLSCLLRDMGVLFAHGTVSLFVWPLLHDVVHDARALAYCCRVLAFQILGCNPAMLRKAYVALLV